VGHSRPTNKDTDYKVFMALANHVGHDKRGNRTYMRDGEGNEIIEARKERVREVHQGVPVTREVESRSKVVDDNTNELARRFLVWRKKEWYF
jgi:type I restriction enzyme M protein